MATTCDRLRFTAAAALCLAALCLAFLPWPAAGDANGSPQACTDGARELRLGFYAFFAPVSYSADRDPASPGFGTHLGFEADLLTALEAMRNTGLSFSRRGIAPWDDIWLRPAGPEYDVVSGGITILDSRTRDADGRQVIAFSTGYIAFRQSLLVRAEDADRLADYDRLTDDVTVGVLANTTGEARLLQLTGLTGEDGALAAGVRVETPAGTVAADGSAEYFITSAGESPLLAKRLRLHPPSADAPRIVYLGDDLGERELIAALRDGRIDAIARGEIGNSDAAHDSGGDLVVAALDDRVEWGGMALPAGDAELIACLDERIDWLTDRRKIGYTQWRADSAVFMRRAAAWNARIP